MTAIEQRVRDAYLALEPTEDLNARTLARIGAFAETEGGAADDRPIPHVAPSAKEPRRRPRKFVLGLVAAAACLAVALFGAYSLLFTPSAYVDIDINPSIELGVNRLGTVVEAEGMNEDGKKVLEALSGSGVTLVGKGYADAIGTLTSSASLVSYLGENAFAQVSIACDDDSQAATLEAESERALASLPCASSCQRASAEQHHDAQAAGMGMGRYRVACELVAEDPTYTMEKCAQMTMAELRAALGHHGEGTTAEGASAGSHDEARNEHASSNSSSAASGSAHATEEAGHHHAGSKSGEHAV